MNNKVAVYRKEHFNAAHRLYNPTWNEEKKCIMFINIFSDSEEEEEEYDEEDC